MRKSAPVASISASACGRMRPSGTGVGTVVSPSGRFSHWSSVAFRPPAFLVWREAVGVDDSRAVFAFANVAAECQGLAKREPALTGKAAFDDGAPKDQHIDAGVAALGRRVLRHVEGRLGGRGLPGLDPGHATGFQVGDDLIGDFLIEARPVSTGTSASG